MSKNIRYTHRYTHPNGFTGLLYGKSSLVVQNSEGRDVFHTGFRNIDTLDELKKWLDDFPKFMEMLNSYWSDNDDCTKSDLIDRWNRRTAANPSEINANAPNSGENNLGE